MQRHDNGILSTSSWRTAITLPTLLLAVSCGAADGRPYKADANLKRDVANGPEVKPEVPPEAGRETAGPPTDEQSCAASTSVLPCDPERAHATIGRTAGSVLLAAVTVTQGECQVSACTSGCASVEVYASATQSGGSTCDLLVTATDGRTQSVELELVKNPTPTHACCGYPLPPNSGMWVVLDPWVISPRAVVVDFPPLVDGGAPALDAPAVDAAPDAASAPDAAGGIDGPALDGLAVGIDATSRRDGEAADALTEAEACRAATGVAPCDPGAPGTTVRSATGQPFLRSVEVTSGSCTGSSCPAGCASLSLLGSVSQQSGATCDLLVTLVDGSQQSFELLVHANPEPTHTCCGYPLPPYSGIWTELNPLVFWDGPVIVMPPGWDGGAITVDAAVVE